MDRSRRVHVGYGPHKTLYDRFVRWSRAGVFNRIFAGLAAEGGAPDQLMVDAAYLESHRRAAALRKKGLSGSTVPWTIAASASLRAVSGARKAD